MTQHLLALTLIGCVGAALATGEHQRKKAALRRNRDGQCALCSTPIAQPQLETSAISGSDLATRSARVCQRCARFHKRGGKIMWAALLLAFGATLAALFLR